MLVAIRVQRRARIRIAAVQQVSVWLEACKSDLDDQRGPKESLLQFARSAPEFARPG